MKFLIRIMILLGVLPTLLAAPYKGVRGIALSGALHGTLGLNESIYVNPAAFAYAQRYSVEAHSFLSPSQTQNSIWTYTGSIVDAHSQSLAAGFSYTRRMQDQAGGAWVENAYHLAVSKILKEVVSVGVTGKYLNQNLEGRAGLAGEEKNHFNFDLGSFWVLTPSIQAGVVLHNLLGEFVTSAEETEKLKRELALGTRINAWKYFYVSLDALKNIDTAILKDYQFLGAMEMVHENGVVSQVGLSLSDKSSQNHYSLGVGWSEHKFGAFYAFQNSLDGLRRITHALSLRVFFD